MATRFDVTTNPAAQSLLEHIQQHWSLLLTHDKLDVTLHAVGQSTARRYEIYIGDEFYHADIRYLDVVIKPGCDAQDADEQDAPLLPAVLVFEKQTATLVQQELNGLSLATPIIAGLAAEPDGDCDVAELPGNLLAARQTAIGSSARSGCCSRAY